MRLLTSSNEAKILQAALSHYLISATGKESQHAQALLTRISTCLEMQGYKKAANLKKTDG